MDSLAINTQFLREWDMDKKNRINKFVRTLGDKVVLKLFNDTLTLFVDRDDFPFDLNKLGSMSRVDDGGDRTKELVGFFPRNSKVKIGGVRYRIFRVYTQEETSNYIIPEHIMALFHRTNIECALNTNGDINIYELTDLVGILRGMRWKGEDNE